MKDFENILTKILGEKKLHALFLNTLSYLENCGARKIAGCEHPTLVKTEMLKHAAEESRHAYVLKLMSHKLGNEWDTYEEASLIGSAVSRRYLDLLEVYVCRFLKNENLNKKEFIELSYLLVTYAIECRADEMYPLYQSLLEKYKLPVSVRAIIAEEEQHLQEMEENLSHYSSGVWYKKESLKLEQIVFNKWIKELNQYLNNYFDEKKDQGNRCQKGESSSKRAVSL